MQLRLEIVQILAQPSGIASPGVPRRAGGSILGDGGEREQPVDARDEELQLLRARRALVRPWNRHELGRGGIRSALELKQAQAHAAA